MKATETSKDLALNMLHKLNDILVKKNLVDKSMSMQTMGILVSPMQDLEWEGKAKYAKQLIAILETSKTEEEILERTTKIQV